AYVFFESLDEDLGRPERRALDQRLVIDPAARNEGRGGGVARGAIAREAEVDERAEVVGGDLTTGLGGKGLDLFDADPEAFRRDERRDPPVAEATGPAHGRLAVAADPQRERLLNRPGQHTDPLELPELAGERDCLFGPAPAHDGDRLVGAPAALLEGHAGRAELAFLLDADTDRGEHASAGEVIDHRHF